MKIQIEQEVINQKCLQKEKDQQAKTAENS